MRSSFRIAIAAASLSCAGAHASFVDDFSAAQGSATITFSGRNQTVNSATPWAPFDLTVRNTFVQNFSGSGSTLAASSEISGGSLNLLLASGLGANGAAGVGYALNGFNAGTLDRFRIQYTFNSSATNVGLAIFVEDMSGNRLIGVSAPATTGTGVTRDVLFSSLAQLSGTGFNWSAVKTLSMYFTVTSGSLSTSQSISVDSFGAIPAPGAIALLGVAGLVGARRRR